MKYSFIGNLAHGPVDVVGDVHGEIDALESLLDRLGYGRRGDHPEKRKLVFVGDLCDRGPDSPAVVARVRDLMARANAQCVLGNHELNILRGSHKSGNRWFLDPAHPEQQFGGEFAHCASIDGTASDEVLEFFATLPLALERPDLRIVHAAWHRQAVDTLRGASGTVLSQYERYEALTNERIRLEGLREAAMEEEAQWGEQLSNKFTTVPMLSATGRLDMLYQMGNPVRVLTSGVETIARTPFFSSGKWRMCDRVRWWDEYYERPAVVVGHYWRQLEPISHADHGASKPALFPHEAPEDWVGPARNVFCVDFSVGARYQERQSGASRFSTRLAAMRLPERVLVLSEDQEHR
ncbi:MAG: metallophosphoesterase [Gammaproteobacteria bacterium]